MSRWPVNSASEEEPCDPRCLPVVRFERQQVPCVLGFFVACELEPFWHINRFQRHSNDQVQLSVLGSSCIMKRGVCECRVAREKQN